MLDLMEWHLQVQLRTPQLAGNAQWVFKDFGTPLRPENPIPYVNQKGLVDRAGRPKDLYYLFQSYLTTVPMCYIESPTWTIRRGRPGKAQRVRVYSNCSRVSLYVNGTFCGQRQREGTAFPAAGLVWNVLLQSGQNVLRAVGVAVDRQHVEQTITLEYYEGLPAPGVAFAWQIESVQTLDGCAGTRVTVQLVDRYRIPVVEDRRRVEFALRGAGTLYAGLGAVDSSRVIELSNGSASIVVLGAETAELLVIAQDMSDTIIPLAPDLMDI